MSSSEKLLPPEIEYILNNEDLLGEDGARESKLETELMEENENASLTSRMHKVDLVDVFSSFLAPQFRFEGRNPLEQELQHLQQLRHNEYLEREKRASSKQPISEAIVDDDGNESHKADNATGPDSGEECSKEKDGTMAKKKLSLSNSSAFNRQNSWNASNIPVPLKTMIQKNFKIAKQEEKKLLGPAYYNVSDYYKHQNEKKLRLGRGVLETCHPRFPKEKPLEMGPTPTTHGNPWTNLEVADDHRRSNAKGCGQMSLATPRFPQSRHAGSGISPTRYNIKSSLKVLEPRANYDYGTENCEKVKGFQDSGDYWPGLPMGTMTDEMNNYSNKFKGVWSSKVDRFSRLRGGRNDVVAPLSVDPNDKTPGPGAYFTSQLKKQYCELKPRNVVKISGSEAIMTEELTTGSDVGPGRYNVERGYSYFAKIKGLGYQSNFKSTTLRVLDDKKAFQKLTERLRGKDIPYRERNTFENEDCSC